MALGGFIALFMLLPNDASSRLQIFCVSVLVLSVGATLFYLKGKR
jgi:hypothetical protein